MKDYKEVAERVFQRSEEILAENRRKKRARIRVGSLACCLAVLLGFAVWQRGVLPRENLASADQFAQDGRDHSGESDVVLDNGNSDLDGDPGGYSAGPGEASVGSDKISEQDLESMSGFMLLPDSDVGVEMPEVTRMISSYGDGDPEANWAVPENGTVELSSALRGAIEEYGDSVQYRVFVELFCDGQALEMDRPLMEKETDRLAALGYRVAVEVYYDQGTITDHYFTLHATMEQVNCFAASAEYGYRLSLYHERVPSAHPDGEETVF